MLGYDYSHSHSDRNECIDMSLLDKFRYIVTAVPPTWPLDSLRLPSTGTTSPQQQNGFDCGIFVIHTFFCFLKGDVVTAPPPNFRKTVLQWILD